MPQQSKTIGIKISPIETKKDNQYNKLFRSYFLSRSGEIFYFYKDNGKNKRTKRRIS